MKRRIILLLDLFAGMAIYAADTMQNTPAATPAAAAANTEPGFFPSFGGKLYGFVASWLNGTLSTAERLCLFGVLAVLSLILAVLCTYVLRVRQSTLSREFTYKSATAGAVKYPVFWCILLTGVYFSLKVFAFSGKIASAIHHWYFFLLIILILRGLLNAVNMISDVFRKKAKKSRNTYNELLLSLLEPTAKTLIWLIGILFILDNVFHFKIGTLLAGAGIASMAVAFAAQNTLANLFGAIALIMERPFMVGDEIKVNDKDGTVQSIGLRSVQIRDLNGTIWYIPNKLIAETSIVNISRRPFFRYTFVLNLTYAHTLERIQEAKELLKGILAETPLVVQSQRAPRITFEKIGESSLDVQVVCWVQTGQVAEFGKVKDDLNSRILKAFNEKGLDFAFPSQSIYVEKMPKP